MVLVWHATAQTSTPSSNPQTEQTSEGSDTSLGVAARKAKAQKSSRPSKTFTDEDMDARSGPLPRLRLDGPDNAEDVLDAIYTYKTAHTAEQTEQAIHDWYDRYDQMVLAAINQNRNMNTVRNVNGNNTYDLCQESEDPRSCQYNQRSSGESMRSDSTVMMKNSNLQQRIQQDMARISVGLFEANLRYEWFKLRAFDGSEIPSFPKIARPR
jgi:hypothetical protein